MNLLTDQITDWIKEALIVGITSNFNEMYNDVNTQVVNIATNVSKTPREFNAGVFSMIQNLSETVIIPIAGMILTFVVCYELIHMIIEKNNMHDFDTWILFKWIFKTFVAVYILTHTFELVMGVFGLAQHVVNQSARVINGNLDFQPAMDSLPATLQAMEWGELLGLYTETMLIKFLMRGLGILIFIITYGRMLEIYLTVSIAPIPLSTMANRDWGQMGNNYIKSLFALGFQGFLIMVCVAIYAALINGLSVSSDVHVAIWTHLAYTILLGFTLMKTGSLAKSLFGSH